MSHDKIRTWNPNTTDLFLSAGMAILFPLLAGVLYTATGALLPMALYYAAAWGICLWRRGSSGYRLKKLPPPPVSFYVHLAILIVTLSFAYFSRIEVESPNIGGVVFTILIWATANASSEQLLWIYIFDAWDLYAKNRFGRRGRLIMRIVGLLMFSSFVGTIHTMYWARFFHTIDPGTIFGILFIIATTASGYMHIIVWRKSARMIYTFIPHFLLNVLQILWTGYSIVPYLLGVN